MLSPTRASLSEGTAMSRMSTCGAGVSWICEALLGVRSYAIGAGSVSDGSALNT